VLDKEDHGSHIMDNSYKDIPAAATREHRKPIRRLRLDSKKTLHKAQTDCYTPLHKSTAELRPRAEHLHAIIIEEGKNKCEC
jgi:hypothetical protein